MEYEDFIESKSKKMEAVGFSSISINPMLFDFQQAIPRTSMKVDHYFAVPSSDVPILGRDNMELIADYGTPDVYAVVVINATDWEAEQKRVAALEQDAALFAALRDKFAYVGVNQHARKCLWVLRDIEEVHGDFEKDIRAAIEKGGANGKVKVPA